MLPIPRVLLPVLLLALLPACAVGRFTKNEPIDVEAYHALQPGASGAADVVAALGAPTEVVQLGRRSAYRYDATNEKVAALILMVFNMANEDTRSDRVWLFFDEDDVLTHKAASFSTHRTQYAAIWEDVHEEEDNVARDAERKGMETGK